MNKYKFISLILILGITIAFGIYVFMQNNKDEESKSELNKEISESIEALKSEGNFKEVFAVQRQLDEKSNYTSDRTSIIKSYDELEYCSKEKTGFGDSDTFIGSEFEVYQDSSKKYLKLYPQEGTESPYPVDWIEIPSSEFPDLNEENFEKINVNFKTANFIGLLEKLNEFELTDFTSSENQYNLKIKHNSELKTALEDILKANIDIDGITEDVALILDMDGKVIIKATIETENGTLSYVIERNTDEKCSLE